MGTKNTLIKLILKLETESDRLEFREEWVFMGKNEQQTKKVRIASTIEKIKLEGILIISK